jgi:import receptor subunit TOM22
LTFPGAASPCPYHHAYAKINFFEICCTSFECIEHHRTKIRFNSIKLATMVKLEEVADEDLTRPQAGPEHDEDEWDTDSGSFCSVSLLSFMKDSIISTRINFYSLNAITTCYILFGPSQLTAFFVLDSDASSITSSIADDETLYDRIVALQDIIPAKQRRAIGRSINTATSWVKSGLSFGGNTLWVVSTSALLLGVPWAIAYAEDQQVAEAEQQMKMQQTANDVSTRRS